MAEIQTSPPVVIMVHWLIRPGSEQAFERFWQSMTVARGVGLYREMLTRPDPMDDPKFTTFSITDTSYSTYINIGLWRSVADFDSAVGKYIPTTTEVTDPSTGRKQRTITIEDFEFKIRERIILRTISDRSGGAELPVTSL
jgi:hypothetical protein